MSIESVEGIIGKTPPGIYHSPDGKKIVGIAAGISAAAGLAIGGSAWFIYSPQAAHLRERVTKIFGGSVAENPRWSAYLPCMLDDVDDLEVARTELTAAFNTSVPVLHTRMYDPIIGEMEPVEVPEFSVRRLNYSNRVTSKPSLNNKYIYCHYLVCVIVDYPSRVY